MKIISNNECYIQGKDINYITNYVPMIDEDIKIKLSGLYLNDSKYIKVDDSELISFIKSCEFLISFDYLFLLDLSILERMILKLRIELSDMEHEVDCISCEGDRIEYLEKTKNKRKNKEYLIEQINSMIEYKKGKSMCNFPNIPNPCIESVVSGDLVASLSLNYENVLIYNINNSLFNCINNPEFCDIAYRLFMHDRFGSDIDKVCVGQKLSDDMKYVLVSCINLENIANNNYERKL